MRKYIVIALWALTTLSIGACQSKSSRIDDLKDFVEEIQKDGKDYSQEQWEKANEKFSQLLDKINSYEDLSEDELKEVAKLQGQYAATVFKNSGKAIMEQMEKAGAALDGFLNSGKAIMEQMEKAGAALDGFLEGVDQGWDNNQEEENE